jgi:hypothetical protein
VFNAFGLRNHHLVKLSRSNLENHTTALFFADHIPSPGILNGEIAHIHSGNDHSAHVLLAPADCMFIASFFANFFADFFADFFAVICAASYAWPCTNSHLGIKVIEAGWGQRHAFSGSSAMTYISLGTRPDIPAEYLLIYAPRTEAEIETVMQIIAASVKFMTGREDVR